MKFRKSDNIPLIERWQRENDTIILVDQEERAYKKGRNFNRFSDLIQMRESHKFGMHK